VYTLDGGSKLIKGPIFANIVFFDELNRTPSRSQAALLEALQERQVTIDGVTYALPSPFMVIATQLPQEFGVGTFPLTLTLIDRFSAKIRTTYSRSEDELKMLDLADYLTSAGVSRIASPEDISSLIDFIKKGVHVSSRVKKYIVDVLGYIRSREPVFGVSHRALISILKTSRALALIEGRDYVIPDDIKALATPVIAHRIIMKPNSEVEAEDVVKEALESVEVPKD